MHLVRLRLPRVLILDAGDVFFAFADDKAALAEQLGIADGEELVEGVLLFRGDLAAKLA